MSQVMQGSAGTHKGQIQIPNRDLNSEHESGLEEPDLA